MFVVFHCMGFARAAVGIVAGAGLVGAGYAGVAGQDDTARDETGQIVEAGDVGAFRIRTGDCFNTAQTDEIESVDGVPCSTPHDGEVYFAFNLPEGDGSFPGDELVAQQSEDRCYDEFEPFVGNSYEASVYGFWPLRPTAGSWNALDDREVLCVLTNYDGTKKVGSGKATGL